jgi:hypothetical protein
LIQPNDEQLGKVFQECDWLGLQEQQQEWPGRYWEQEESLLEEMQVSHFQVEDIQMEKVLRKLCNLLHHSPPKRSEDQF